MSRTVKSLLVCLLLTAAGGVMPATAAATHFGNDDRQNPFSVPLDTPVADDNFSATVQPPSVEAQGCLYDPPVYFGATVWFRVIGNGQEIVFTTAGSNFDTVLAVYPPPPVIGTCADDRPGVDLTSEVRLQTEVGVEYEVQVGGFCPPPVQPAPGCDVDPRRGEIVFGAFNADRLTGPANDKRTNPELVATGSRISFSNFQAGIDADDGVTECNSRTFGATVWFRYVAPAPGTLQLIASGGLETALAVFAGNSHTRLACDADPDLNLLSLEVSEGQEYLIQLGGVNGETGAGGLRVQFTERCDIDGDGVNGRCSPSPPDCDDRDRSINPRVAEILNNDVDENCDGFRDFDRDRDGAPVSVPGRNLAGKDCSGVPGRPDGPENDGNPAVHPGARDVPLNGLDEDCDGQPPLVAQATPDARLPYTFRNRTKNRWVKASLLTVTGAPQGARIEITCRRKRRNACRRQTKTATGGTVSFKTLRAKRLKKGTLVEVRVMGGNFVGRYFAFRVVRGKVKRTVRCLDPSSAKPQARCLGSAF